MIVFLTLLLTSSALAQRDFLPDRDKHPESYRLERASLNRRKSAAPDLRAIPELLGRRLRELHNLPAESCESETADRYLMSLAQAGKYDDCARFARQCAEHPNVSVHVLTQGASCLVSLQQHQAALELFQRGPSKPSFASEASVFLLDFALFTEFGVHADLTESVIALHPSWSAEEKRLARGLVSLLGEANLGTGLTKAQIRAFLEAQLSLATGRYAQRLKFHRVSIAANEYEYDQATRLLLQDAAGFDSATALWELSFAILYRTSGGNFALTENLYRVFAPYAHSRSYLPVEQNVLNYTEIQNSACREVMMTSRERKKLARKIKSWRKGSLSFASFSEHVSGLVRQRRTSDILTVYGNLLSMQGEWAQARAHYWEAHQLCPFNNRSHWGLRLLNRQERYLAYPEYDANEARVTSELAAVRFPPELTKYVMNWRAFPERSQRFIKHGLIPYARFLTRMNQTGYKTYVKLPFELLSDTPPNPELRDVRITYQNDHRLWDDVRGSGGQEVVADHDETMQSPHGAYNLMVHEVAHQFHSFLAANRQELGSCLDRLYDAAKRRDVFPDGYAASNVDEYFAQGVTYFMIPAEAPARFGINSSWLGPNDPDLKRFIESFIASEGNLEAIECPI